MIVPILTRRDFNKGNIGDAYICMGLQYLWEKAAPEHVDWLLLDKFDKGGDFRQFESIIRDAGRLVVAGTPQYNNLDDWCFWYDENVWTSYVAKWGLQAYTLAGGSGHPDPHIGAEAFSAYLMGSHKTKRIVKIRDNHSVLTTVRDPYAHQFLNDMHVDNHLLPCTATWAAKKRGVKKRKGKYVVLVSPSSAHLSFEATNTDDDSVRLEAPRDLMKRMYLVYKRMGKEVVVVCHGIKEYMYLRGEIPAEHLHYSNDSHSALQLYADAELVVSARLHGALPAYGMGNVKVHMIGIDSRATAVDMFPHLSRTQLPDLLSIRGEEFEAWCSARLAQEPADSSWLKVQEAKYIKLLKEHM